VVSSPLLRARQTADALGLPYDIDDRWQELDYGVHDGATMASVGAATWARWRSDVHFAPEGGESLDQLSRRVREACADLASEARDHHVVVFTHVSPIKAAVAWALGVDVSISWRCHLDQASVSRIVVHDSGPVLLGFNESASMG
jgi:broad specificity phosphatase PhoE